MLNRKHIKQFILISLALPILCCKDGKIDNKGAVELPQKISQTAEYQKWPDNKASRDYAKIDAVNDTADIEKLKIAFKDKNEVLFLAQFPADFQQFMDYFGWNTKSEQPAELYEESNAYMDYYFELLSNGQHKAFENKLMGIAENGHWQADAVNYFQHHVINRIKENEKYYLINQLSNDRAKSVLFFLFDGPHPKFDADFASHLSPSKKEILGELFETGFYDENENQDPILPHPEIPDPIDYEGSIHYYLSDFEGNEHFFIRDIDINNDGVLDKIVSAERYKGDELFLFINEGKEYHFTLKTINFSEDGGNQIVDVVAEETGFLIKTAFPDGGLLEVYHHIVYRNEHWVLTNTIYKTQSSNQEDAFIYVCDVEQGFILADGDLQNKLKWLPNEKDRESLCNKELK